MSKTTISTITGKILEGTAEWQNRPLDPVVVVVDCIHVKARDRQIDNRSFVSGSAEGVLWRPDKD